MLWTAGATSHRTNPICFSANCRCRLISLARKTLYRHSTRLPKAQDQFPATALGADGQDFFREGADLVLIQALAAQLDTDGIAVRLKVDQGEEVHRQDLLGRRERSLSPIGAVAYRSSSR